MHERGFWDDYAEAMALTIEGNRLIVGEIAACLRDQWRAVLRWISAALHHAPGARHLPPV